MASQSRDSRWVSMAKGLTCRCLSRTTKAPSRRFDQRSSSAIDASWGPTYTAEPGTDDADRLALAIILGTQELIH